MALLVALLLAGTAARPDTAAAQHGNGLYEPFPRAAVLERAKRFVEGFRFPRAAERLRFSDEQLARGVFVDTRVTGLPKGDGLGRTPAAAASARAGVDEAAGSWLAPGVWITLVLVAVVTFAVLAGRRPRRRVAAV
jgi:hypothetical protein